jgi:transcriptional regulator with PAS, ATPase and Fis domain
VVHDARAVPDAIIDSPLLRIELGQCDTVATASCRFKAEQSEDTAARLAPLIQCLEHLAQQGPRARGTKDLLVGECSKIRNLRGYLSQVARVNSTVLITGETGTGKQLVAETIHRESARREGPFVTVNCAAIPETLLESELFGYEKGAFTGAGTAKPGKLELADGGTFFLDEIGDMNLVAQAKLLRVLESGQVERLGGRRGQRFDVRFVAATNQDLEKLVEQRAFRKDLYYRLNVARVALPPLRERVEDIPLLLAYYMTALGDPLGIQVEGFSEEALARLVAYPWPGNVRELRNLVEAMLVSRPAGRLCAEHLPLPYGITPGVTPGITPAGAKIHADERQRVLSALSTTNWNVSKAAQRLQWSRMTLYRKMAKHQINRPVEWDEHQDAAP